MENLNESLKKINQDLIALGEKLSSIKTASFKTSQSAEDLSYSALNTKPKDWLIATISTSEVEKSKIKEELKHYTELADALNKKVKDQQNQITDLIQSNEKLRENEASLTASLKRGNDLLQESYKQIQKLNEDITKLSAKIIKLQENQKGFKVGDFTGRDGAKLGEATGPCTFKFEPVITPLSATTLSDTTTLLAQNANLKLKVKQLENALFESVVEKESVQSELTDLNSNYSKVLTENHQQAKSIRELKNELEVKRATIQNYEKDIEGKSQKIHLFEEGLKEAGYENLPRLLESHTLIVNELALTRLLQDKATLDHKDLKAPLMEARGQRDQLKYENGKLQKRLQVAENGKGISNLEIKNLKEGLKIAEEARDHFKAETERLIKVKNSLADERDKLQEQKNYSDDLIVKQRQTIIDLNNSTNNYSVDQMAELTGRLDKQHIELNQLYRERKTYRKLDIELATTKKLLEKEEKLVAVMRQKAYEYKKECEDLKRYIAQTPTLVDLQEREKTDVAQDELLTNLLNELSLKNVLELKDYIEKLQKDFKEFMGTPQFTGSRGFEDTALLSLLQSEGIRSRYDLEDHLTKYSLMSAKLKSLREDALKIFGEKERSYQYLKNQIDLMLRP